MLWWTVWNIITRARGKKEKKKTLLLIIIYNHLRVVTYAGSAALQPCPRPVAAKEEGVQKRVLKISTRSGAVWHVRLRVVFFFPKCYFFFFIFLSRSLFPLARARPVLFGTNPPAIISDAWNAGNKTEENTRWRIYRRLKTTCITQNIRTRIILLWNNMLHAYYDINTLPYLRGAVLRFQSSSRHSCRDNYLFL